MTTAQNYVEGTKKRKPKEALNVSTSEVTQSEKKKKSSQKGKVSS